MTKAASTSLSASLMRIGGVIVPIVIAIFLIFSQANFLIGRALLIAFGEYETRYKSASLEWDGDVVAKDFVLYPFDVEDEESAVRFEHVHLETPGWFWFLRNTFDRKLKRAHLDRLHLTLTGGSSASGIDPSLGDLGPIGAISASPFEAEGCMQDTLWEREELVAMGLEPGPTTLEFDYRVERGELLTTVILDTKGSSRVQMDRIASLPGETNMLLLDYFADETRSERWEVQDQGFVAARNRFCAKKDKVEPLRFVGRHVESVVRLMDTLGVSVDKDTLTMYRRFARDGGKLNYYIAYGKPLPSELLYELREHPTVLSSSRATLDHNGRATAIRWDRFDPIPLPAVDEGEPTYAALLKEQAASVRTEAPTEGLPGGTVTATGTDVAAAAVVPIESAATTEPESIEDLIANRTAASNAAKAAATEPDVSAAATAAPPSAATTPVTSAPTATSSPVIDVATTAPARRGVKQLQWDDLSTMQGRLVRIWTVHNPPRTVEILSTDGSTLRVTARLGGGNAEYSIQRNAFLRATLVR